MLFSLVIPTYNRADLVGQAVQSALDQTWPDVETIVVDDGSVDGTAEALACLMPRISFIRQENKGLAGARNAGWRAAHGELVGFLDSDDLWRPRLCEAVVHRFRERPDADAVALSEQPIDLGGQTTAKIRTKKTPGAWFTPEGLIGRDTGIGSGRPPVVRRAVLESSGGFDESFGSYAVDSEMWVRLAFTIRMTILEEPLVLRRVHPGNVSGDRTSDAEHWLRILDWVERAHPDFARSRAALLRRTRAKQHLRIGRELLARAANVTDAAATISAARRHLRDAARMWPWFRRAWIYLAWSHLAPRTYATFRAAELRRL